MHDCACYTVIMGKIHTACTAVPIIRMCCILYQNIPMIKSHPTAFGKLSTSLLNVMGCMVSSGRGRWPDQVQINPNTQNCTIVLISLLNWQQILSFSSQQQLQLVVYIMYLAFLTFHRHKTLICFVYETLQSVSVHKKL